MLQMELWLLNVHLNLIHGYLLVCPCLEQKESNTCWNLGLGSNNSLSHLTPPGVSSLKRVGTFCCTPVVRAFAPQSPALSLSHPDNPLCSLAPFFYSQAVWCVSEMPKTNEHAWHASLLTNRLGLIFKHWMDTCVAFSNLPGKKNSQLV